MANIITNFIGRVTVSAIVGAAVASAVIYYNRDAATQARQLQLIDQITAVEARIDQDAATVAQTQAQISQDIADLTDDIHREIRVLRLQIGTVSSNIRGDQGNRTQELLARIEVLETKMVEAGLITLTSESE